MEETKTYANRTKVKAVFLCLATIGVLMYQAYLHNTILDQMYGSGYIAGAFWTADVILSLLFALWIWEAHATIIAVRKKQNSGFGEAREATSVCRDVVGPIITWIIYITLIITKTGFIFYGFMNEHEELLRDQKTTGDLKWALLMIGGVFMLETWSNGNALPNPERENFLYAASTMVFFDLFDAAEIMDFWFGNQQVPNLEMIRMVALGFHCFCLIFPIFTVGTVHSSRYGVVPINEKYEGIHKFIRSIMINLPFLVLRSIDAYYQDVNQGDISYVTKALIAKNSYILLCTCVTFFSNRRCNDDS